MKLSTSKENITHTIYIERERGTWRQGGLSIYRYKDKVWRREGERDREIANIYLLYLIRYRTHKYMSAANPKEYSGNTGI